MKQKTAIRQLIEFMEIWNGKITYNEALFHARSLEPINEQQIKDAVNAIHPMQRIGLDCEQYFNETFEKP